MDSTVPPSGRFTSQTVVSTSIVTVAVLLVALPSEAVNVKLSAPV